MTGVDTQEVLVQLDGGAAIVTGAAGGIGAALVRRLAAAGMTVVAADLDADALVALADDVAGVVAVPGDVSEPAHHDELVAAAREAGGLRLSVQNAGVSFTGLSWEVSLARWELVVQVNYWGVVHGVRAALGEMVPAGAGHVVAVASGAGLVATPGLAPYVSTKHAVVGLMESVHHELARSGCGVGASVVCPGNVATDIVGRSERVAERSTPAGSSQVGDGPQRTELTEELDATVRSGVAEGASPDTVAGAVLDGVRAGRFWILPQPEIGWAAHDRMRRVMEGEDPVDLLG